MTIIDSGVQGAKRTAMRNDRLMLLAQDVIRSKPRSETNPLSTRMARRFQEMVESDADRDELNAMVYEYVWTNLGQRALRAKKTSAQKKADAAAAADRVVLSKRKIQNRIEAKAQQMFLDMEMPNGKRLGECSFKEVGQMAPKLGKLFRFLPKAGKPNQIVGDVYKTNDELIAAAKIG